MYLQEKEKIALWPVGEIPGMDPAGKNEENWVDDGWIPRVSHVTHPELYCYPAENAAPGAPAVLIVPGGGYTIIAMKHEGSRVAEALNERGIHAFVLKYRLPDMGLRAGLCLWPLEDLQKSILILRQRSCDWGLEKDKIGMMGFSAGGHLVGMGSVLYDRPLIETEGISLRPDFSLPIYAVLSMREQYGDRPSEDPPSLGGVFTFSLEDYVTEDTPPTYLCHANNDEMVPVSNSLIYKKALDNKGVPSFLDLLPKGGHGFGMNEDSPATGWFDRAVDWIMALYEK